MNTFRNPDGLAAPNGFSHVAQSSLTKMILVSGQVSYDNSGAVVGVGDLAAQTRQIYENIRVALEAVGASLDDVVKTTLFVKELSPDKARVIREARAPFLDVQAPPASTMVGVTSLARPELLLEVEAMAMVK